MMEAPRQFECYIGAGTATMSLNQFAAAADIPLDHVRRELAEWIVNTGGACRHTHLDDHGGDLRLNRRGVALMLERVGIDGGIATEIERRLDASEMHVRAFSDHEPRHGRGAP